MAKVIKSFYILYFIKAQRAALRGNLDSLNSKVKRGNAPAPGIRKFTFGYTPQGSNIVFQQEMTSLDVLEPETTYAFVDTFRTICTLCNWSDEASVANLKAMVSLSILPYILQKRTLDSALDTLLSIAYPPEDRHMYDGKLRAIKQTNFQLISEYSSEIRSLFTKYCLCANLKPSSQALREEEYFLNGLDPEVVIQLNEQGCTTKEQIELKIQSAEKAILTNLEKIDRSDPIQRIEKDNICYTPTMLKYCKTHGTCKHDTSECRKIPKAAPTSNSSKDQKNSKKALIIRVPKPNISSIEFEGLSNDREITLQVDPGASKCYISEEKAKELN